MSDPDAYFYLVMDELHLIRGSSGTEVAGLIRYLIHRLGLDQPEHRYKLRILASSASLPTDGLVAIESLKYLTDFFGCNGLYKTSTDCPDVKQWLDAIVKGEQVGFDSVSDKLDASLFVKFTEQFLKSDFDYDDYKNISEVQKSVEYLNDTFENHMLDIFNSLSLSDGLFVERLKALIKHSSNLLNSYCFDNEKNIIYNIIFTI